MSNSESAAFSFAISSVLMETDNLTEEMIELIRSAIVEKLSVQELLDSFEAR